MDTENPGAPPHAQSLIPGKNHPHARQHSGVVHDNVRHTENFTVIGNHLVQHQELLLLAIGLACSIQSAWPPSFRLRPRSGPRPTPARNPEAPSRPATAVTAPSDPQPPAAVATAEPT